MALLSAGCLQHGDGADPVDEPVPGEAAACPSAHTTDAAPEDPSPAPVPVREGFETLPSIVVVNGLPAGWSATDGSWQVRADDRAPEGDKVLYGQGDADPGFSMALAGSAGSLSDLEMQVSFRIACVEHPSGIGVVLHVAGPEEYQILRFSPTESSWDMFTVKDGVRERQPTAAILPGTDPEPGAWTTLRVTSEGGRIEAFDGATQVLGFDLPAGHAGEGQVGLFLRGASSGDFDDVRVDALPVAVPA